MLKILKKISTAGLVLGLSMLLTTPVLAAGGKQLKTQLSGTAEVPGPGDPDGGGAAKVWLNNGKGEICFEISVNNIDTPTAAHIHAAHVGVAGTVVVDLNVPANGLEGCVTVDKELVKNIRSSSQDYYVNVHNAAYPDGAIRGQLAKGKGSKKCQ